jgi:hypothetical protein
LLNTAVRELAIYSIDLMEEEEVRREKIGIKPAGDFMFFNRNGNQRTDQDSAYIRESH